MEISANDNFSALYEELDEKISLDEISNAIAKFKQNKSGGEDDILNELFIKCKSVLLPL